MSALVKQPHEIADTIRVLLELFLSLDVTLHKIVIDWLQPVYGWSISESIVQLAQREIYSPLDFSYHNGRICIAVFRRAESTGADDSENSESEKISVPYVSLNGDAKGFTTATIIEGDLVKLRCRSAITWLVFEICPNQNKVVLAVYKRDTLNGIRPEATCNTHFAGKNGKVQKLKENAIIEKRSFTLSAFTGAIVWREELAALEGSIHDCDDHSTAYDEPSTSGQSQSQIHASTSECCVFQMPVTSSAFILHQLKVMVSRHDNFYKNCEYEQRSTSSCKIPTTKSSKEVPHVASSRASLGKEDRSNIAGVANLYHVFLEATKPSVLLLQRMKVMVTELVQLPLKVQNGSLNAPGKYRSGDRFIYNKEVKRSTSPKRLNGCPPDLVIDRRITVQEQAQAKMWITRKQELFDARRFLWRSDPFSCCLDSQRDRWLLTCRALRALSQGDEDLLGDFYRWTKSAGEEGGLRAKDCRKAWYSLRCLTTSDLPCVVQSRVYIQGRLLAQQQNEFEVEEEVGEESSGRTWIGPGLGFRGIEANADSDPLIRSMLDCVKRVLLGRSLYFLSSITNSDRSVCFDALPFVGNPDFNGTDTMLVPAILYESGTFSSDVDVVNLITQNDFYGLETKDDGREMQDIRIISSEEIIAFIAAGDILLLPFVNSVSILGHKSRKKSSWYQVIFVDLFYARLRVGPCPSPPSCWGHNIAPIPSTWIAISKLWAIPVSRLITPSNSESNSTRFLIFVSPVPSISASFSALKSLPLIQKPTSHLEGDIKEPLLIRKQKPSVPVKQIQCIKSEHLPIRKKQPSLPPKPIQSNKIRKRKSNPERKFIIS